MTSTVSRSARLAAPLYFLAILLIATPAIDFLGSIWPLRPGNIEWRFASIGLFSGFLLTPMLGIALAMVVAAENQHSRTQRVMAIANSVFAFVLIVLLCAFVLDVLQLRNAVQDAQRQAFLSASVKALIKHVLVLALIVWTAKRGFEMSTWKRAEQPKASKAPFLMGLETQK